MFWLTPSTFITARAECSCMEALMRSFLLETLRNQNLNLSEFMKRCELKCGQFFYVGREDLSWFNFVTCWFNPSGDSMPCSTVFTIILYIASISGIFLFVGIRFVSLTFMSIHSQNTPENNMLHFLALYPNFCPEYRVKYVFSLQFLNLYWLTLKKGP